MTHCFLSPDGPRFLHVKINRNKKRKEERKKKKKLFSPHTRQRVIYSCSHCHPPPRTGWEPGARQSYTNKPATGNYLAKGCNFARRGAPGLLCGRTPAHGPGRGDRWPRAGSGTGAAAAGPSAGRGGAAEERGGSARAERGRAGAAPSAPRAAGSARATALRRRRRARRTLK